MSPHPINYPPTLPADILARAFRAPNGELGIMPSDADAFIDACDAAGIGLLGWELWLIDHRIGARDAEPQPAPGLWCGLIPMLGHAAPAVIGGSGNSAHTRQDIAAMDLDARVAGKWRPYLRINFTLDA